MSEITQILERVEEGESRAAEELLPLVYDELRRLAAARMAQEQRGNILQPTALVHEAYLRLVDVDHVQHWQSRGHFFAAAAEAMRRILVEDARRRHRAKYGGQLHRLPLPEISAPADGHDMLSLDDALNGLAEEDPLAAKVVELRWFAGLTLEQIAETLRLTVYRTRQKWTYARAWLRHALREN